MFDGRLVINADCQTNDPCIYAAGPMTKYRRILYADDYRHEYYSSTEIGAWVAKRIFEDLDPWRPHGFAPQRENLKGTVHLHQNSKLAFHPVLDGYYFLSLRCPGKTVPYSLIKTMDNYVCICSVCCSGQAKSFTRN